MSESNSEAAQIDIASAQSSYEDGVKDQAVNLLKAYIQVRLYEEKVLAYRLSSSRSIGRGGTSLPRARSSATPPISRWCCRKRNCENQEATTARLKDELSTRRQALFDLMNVPESDVKLCRNYFNFFSFDASGWNADGAIEEQTRSLKLQIARQEVQEQKSRITWVARAVAARLLRAPVQPERIGHAGRRQFRRHPDGAVSQSVAVGRAAGACAA